MHVGFLYGHESLDLGPSQIQCDLTLTNCIGVSQVVQVVKNLHGMQEMYRRCGFDPWVGKIPWNRKWQPTPVSLPEESHGQRSLAGYSPRGRKRIEQLRD